MRSGARGLVDPPPLIDHPPPSPPVARACTVEEVRALTLDAPTPVRLTCRATLTSSARVVRPLIIEGAESSGAGIDCSGGSIGRAGVASTVSRPSILIQSRPEADGWSRPTDIDLRNCVVHGNIRIWGIGAGGAIDALRASSRRSDHTVRAQAAAPARVTLTDLRLIGTGSIPLYVGPGVTGTRLLGGSVTGRSVSTAVYLDAESAGALIQNVDFDIETGREQIAVDGSARNRIVGNSFDLHGRGGVLLYRNCGEDGVIRHQTPSGNIITANRFLGARWFLPRAVVVGSREGRRSYCGADAGWPFGSSLDDGDHAEGNEVSGNAVVPGWRPF